MGSPQADPPELVPLLAHLARLSRQAAEAAAERDPAVLRPRHVIALDLLSRLGPITQAAMATALTLDPSNVVGLLNELESKGLLVRQRDPTDRRRHIVQLSDHGAAALASSSARYRELENHVFRALSHEERWTIHDLLSRVGGRPSRSAGGTGQ
jgi:DNA-binding MarR family transcriptional regulator